MDTEHTPIHVPDSHHDFQNHEDHIAGKYFDDPLQFGSIFPMPQAMKILDGKKLKPISAWDLRKVKSKKEVIMEAQRDNMRVHFATLMDMCHLKKCGVGTQIAEEQR